VTARPVPILLVTSALLVALASPSLGLRLGASGARTLPANLPSRHALALLEQSFTSATAEPTRVVISGNTSAGDAVGRLERLVAQDREFVGPPRLEHVPGLTALAVYVRGDPGGGRALAAVRRLRSRYIPETRFPSSSQVLVGGPTADSLDYVHSINSSRVRVFVFVLALSFLLLAAAFRSVVVPLKAIVLNLLSVGAAYGVLVLVFQDGLGASLAGLSRTHAVETWVPMLLFALLFGLSMDYHVFLLSRIREQYRERRDTADAVELGIVSTGRIVTGAALVIVVVFASLAGGDLVMFQELGIGVAVALLIDATVVRVLLLPAAMSVLGRWNWWPSSISREAGPLESAGATRPASAARQSAPPLPARRPPPAVP
jgi:RND superfamily putative drug exporter